MDGDWLLQTVAMSGSLVLVSFIVIAIMFRHAKNQLRSFIEMEREPEISSFWVERVLSKRFRTYILFSLVLSLGVTIVSYLLPILVAGPSPWWWTIAPASIIHQILLILAIMMGFLVPRQLYHYLVLEVMEDVRQKLDNTHQPKKTAQTLRIFALVAGGSSSYQVVCMFVTCMLFIIIKLFFVIPHWQQLAGIVPSLDTMPLLTDWVGLLLYALMGGIVGPMATTISVFTIYCSGIFKNGDFFDPLAKDRRGGFKSLGNIGIWSSFMAAVTPGVAIPVLFLPSKLETSSELAVNMGLLFFLMICVVLFFFVPMYYVHKAMKTSRKLQIQKFEDLYRTKFHQFMKRVRSGKVTRMTETSVMLALKEMYQDVVGASDWPVDHLAVMKVMINAALPILSYILKLLAIG